MVPTRQRLTSNHNSGSSMLQRPISRKEKKKKILFPLDQKIFFLLDQLGDQQQQQSMIPIISETSPHQSRTSASSLIHPSHSLILKTPAN
jgi:hypothetical protein